MYGGYLRKHESGFFIVPKLQPGTGGNAKKPAATLAYIWQRFDKQPRGSIYRLIGWIESPVDVNKRLKFMESYKAGPQSDLTPLGTDAVVDPRDFIRKS